ncbi:hypothetical protein B0T14DRAFT_104809 [Immersiella caudata]|uniref:Uncharacterized protein n=1 Tax=Immersiella caudata TaxID=314043 RepID=A0AA39X3T6_9PEZI|nr:hypothetical protein B0T14DRAFT_104809 [Immersiella caudata]
MAVRIPLILCLCVSYKVGPKAGRNTNPLHSTKDPPDLLGNDGCCRTQQSNRHRVLEVPSNPHLGTVPAAFPVVCDLCPKQDLGSLPVKGHPESSRLAGGFAEYLSSPPAKRRLERSRPGDNSVLVERQDSPPLRSCRFRHGHPSRDPFQDDWMNPPPVGMYPAFRRRHSLSPPVVTWDRTGRKDPLVRGVPARTQSVGLAFWWTVFWILFLWYPPDGSFVLTYCWTSPCPRQKMAEPAEERRHIDPDYIPRNWCRSGNQSMHTENKILARAVDCLACSCLRSRHSDRRHLPRHHVVRTGLHHIRNSYLVHRYAQQLNASWKKEAKYPPLSSSW